MSSKSCLCLASLDMHCCVRAVNITSLFATSVRIWLTCNWYGYFVLQPRHHHLHPLQVSIILVHLHVCVCVMVMSPLQLFPGLQVVIAPTWLNLEDDLPNKTPQASFASYSASFCFWTLVVSVWPNPLHAFTPLGVPACMGESMHMQFQHFLPCIALIHCMCSHLLMCFACMGEW